MYILWNRLSLRLRLFIAFGVLFSLVMIISLLLQSRFYSQSRVDSLITQELPAQLQKLGSEVALQLAPSLEVSRSLAANSYIERWIRKGMPESELWMVESEMARVNSQLEAGIVFIAANDGQNIFYHHYQDGQLNRRQMQRNNVDDSWYFSYLGSGAPYELNLDSNEFSGEQLQMFVNYSSNTLNNVGEPISVAGVGLNMLHLAKKVSAYRLGEGGRASLANQDGIVEVKADGALIQDLNSSAALQGLQGHQNVAVAQVVQDGEALFVGTIWIEDLQRYLVVEVPRAEFMDPISQQLYRSMLISFVLLLISLALLYPLATSLSRPLVHFQQQLLGISQTLDLSRRVEVSDQAELGDLAKQTNHLLERLSHIIQAIFRNADNLSESAGRLAHTAGLVNQNSALQQEVSQSMATAVEQMSSSVAEITSTMEELSASSTQIADHSQSVVDVANLTLDSSKKGAKAMQQLMQHMAEIQQDNARSLDEIMQLGAKSKQISKVMDLINTLADQTKLIAFNAALEASSAGDSGKRFSVVASEIRRLADSVTDSTLEIEERIQEIQDSISRLVITSEKGSSSIHNGMDVSAATSDDLSALVLAATKTSNAAQQISLSTKQQKTASSQVVIALRDIANASTHNAQSVRSITEISEEMVNMSSELNSLVQEFKLNQSSAHSES